MFLMRDPTILLYRIRPILHRSNCTAVSLSENAMCLCAVHHSGAVLAASMSAAC